MIPWGLSAWQTRRSGLMESSGCHHTDASSPSIPWSAMHARRQSTIIALQPFSPNQANLALASPFPGFCVVTCV